jgi:tetratricopeptide (TPR) repeat protein
VPHAPETNRPQSEAPPQNADAAQRTERSDEIAALIEHARLAADRNDQAAALESLTRRCLLIRKTSKRGNFAAICSSKPASSTRRSADYAELRTEKGAAWSARPVEPARDWTHVQELFRKGDEEVHRGAHDRALDIYNAILAMDVPHHFASTAAQNRGNVYRAKQDYDRALRDYEQAIRLNRTNAGAYVNRGVMLADRGDHEAAVQDHTEAIRFSPTMAEAFYNRATSFAALGRTEAAVSDFEQAISLNRA